MKKILSKLLNKIIGASIEVLRVFKSKYSLSDLVIAIYYKTVFIEKSKESKFVFEYEDYSEFPKEFDVNIYIDNKYELSKLDRDDITEKYNDGKISKGEIFNEITNRNSFTNLISNISGKKLEIGPFINPSISGSDVYYSDILSSEEILNEVTRIGMKNVVVPKIHFVTKSNLLEKVVPSDIKFKVVISCQNIEHQPCLVTHLNSISNVLEEGGFYFISIPDKRFTADYFSQTSSLTDVISSYINEDKNLKLKNIIEGKFFITHNIPQKHWQGEHGQNPYQSDDKPTLDEMKKIIEKCRQNGEVIDYHSWRFTPSTFREIILQLRMMKMTNLDLIRLYPTIHGSSEFFAILKK